MTDEERLRLARVLEKVRVIHSKTITLESSYNSLINIVSTNCEIDEKTPYEDDLKTMQEENTRTKSSLSGDVIPTLVNRINS